MKNEIVPLLKSLVVVVVGVVVGNILQAKFFPTKTETDTSGS